VVSRATAGADQPTLTLALTLALALALTLALTITTSPNTNTDQVPTNPAALLPLTGGFVD
jgi:hypothetical protein